MNEPKPQAPTEQSLRMLLLQGAAFYEMIEKQISKWNLPWRVEKHPDGTATLEPIFSTGESHLNKFITVNPLMLSMKDRARKMMLTEHPVLITGETGTGKELIAKSMIGDRKGLIQALNCAGFPSELIESELFGHVKGAFTGAYSDKIGLMQSAENGICFLDEVGELEMPVQSKLLRALAEKRIRPVGSNKSVDISCKFVYATNRDLKKMTEGLHPSFRLDLYARISTLEVDLLPLRNRMEDCIPIVSSMDGGEKFLLKYGKDLTEGKLDLRLNVRSLEQYVTRYNVLGEI